MGAGDGRRGRLGSDPAIGTEGGTMASRPGAAAPRGLSRAPGDLAAARACFEQAGTVWATAPGAGEQAAEAMTSSSRPDLVGQRPSRCRSSSAPPVRWPRRGASPVVRAIAWMLSGLAYLADERLPDALKHLMLGLMVERPPATCPVSSVGCCSPDAPTRRSTSRRKRCDGRSAPDSTTAPSRSPRHRL